MAGYSPEDAFNILRLVVAPVIHLAERRALPRSREATNAGKINGEGEKGSDSGDGGGVGGIGGGGGPGDASALRSLVAVLDSFGGPSEGGDAVAACLDYVLLPLWTLLPRVPGEGVRRGIPQVEWEWGLRALHAVMAAVGWRRLESADGVDADGVLSQVLQRCVAAFASVEGGSAPGVDEEVKLAAVGCMIAVLSDRSELDIDSGAARSGAIPASIGEIKSLGSETLTPMLGHAIFSLMEIAKKERNRALVMESLIVSVLLCECSPGHELCAMFLPGISSSIANVCLGDVKQGSQVFSTALLGWGRVLAVGFSDMACGGILPANTSPLDEFWKLCREEGVEGGSAAPALPSLHVSATDNPDTSTPPTLKLTTEWHAATASRLKYLLDEVLGRLVAHRAAVVRSAVLELIQVVQSECQQSLAPALPSLLQHVVGLAQDDIVSVRVASRQLAASILQSLAPDRRSAVLSTLESAIAAAVNELPRVCRGGDELQFRAALNRLTGMIVTTGRGRFEVICESLLSRLATAVCQILEFEQRDAPSLLLLGVADGSTVGYNTDVVGEHEQQVVQSQFPLVHLKFAREPATRDALNSLLHQVCEFGDRWAVLQEMLRISRAANPLVPSSHRSAALLALTMMLEGLVSNVDGITGDTASEPVVAVLRCVATELLSSPLLGAEDAALRCLSLKGLSLCCKGVSTHHTEHQRFMLKALYPVLASLGDSASTVADSALACLHELAKIDGFRTHTTHASGDGSVESLLRSNIDYLVDTVCSKLTSRLLITSAGTASSDLDGTAAVVECVARHAPAAAVPLLRDVVEATLRCVDTHRHSPTLLVGYLRVLRSAARTLTTTSRVDAAEQAAARSLDSQYSILKDVHAARILTGRTVEPTDGGGEAPSVGDGDGASDASDGSHELLKNVLQRAAQFVSAPTAGAATTALETVGDACVGLRGRTDILFPLLHEVWPFMVSAIVETTSSRIVRSAALQCVARVATEARCGEFLARRVGKSLWPHISQSLHENCPWIARPSSKSLKLAALSTNLESDGEAMAGRTFAGLHKQLLCALTAFCSCPEILKPHAWDVCHTAAHFLASDAPQECQRAAVQLFKALASLVHADAVWLYTATLVHHVSKTTARAPDSIEVLPGLDLPHPSFASPSQSLQRLFDCSPELQAVGALDLSSNLSAVWSYLGQQRHASRQSY